MLNEVHASSCLLSKKVNIQHWLSSNCNNGLAPCLLQWGEPLPWITGLSSSCIINFMLAVLKPTFVNLTAHGKRDPSKIWTDASGDISPGVQNQIASITKTYKHSLANLIQLQGNVLDLKRLLRYFINIFNRCTSSVNSPLRIREVDEGAGYLKRS